jgi:Protein of unknown function (DUF3300)
LLVFYLLEAFRNESAEEIQKHEHLLTQRFSRKASSRQPNVGLPLVVIFLFATWPQTVSANQAAQQSPYTQQTPEEIQQLVAPIALYPDSLVAQILAVSWEVKMKIPVGNDFPPKCAVLNRCNATTRGFIGIRLLEAKTEIPI